MSTLGCKLGPYSETRRAASSRVRWGGATDLAERFWAKVDKSAGPESCWRWRGQLHRNGYGVIGGVWAHRRAYELAQGPIPDGLVLDHLCRTLDCVNPRHLEPVTQGENIRRSWPYRSRPTHCRRGHELSGDNVRYYRRQVVCRACRQLRHQVRRRLALAAVVA